MRGGQEAVYSQANHWLKLHRDFAVEPLWLLHGEGPRFRENQAGLNENSAAGTTSRQTAILLLRLLGVA